MNMNSYSQINNQFMPLREYIKAFTKSNIMIRDKFFTSHRMQFPQMESLNDYNPFFVQCMAKWLWVNYKMNDFPYFDLNIINVFSDFPSCLNICEQTMKYYHQNLSPEFFERIHFFMVPLYQVESLNTSLFKQIPGHVELVEDITVSPFKHTSNESFWVQDPVYVLFLNDILKNTSHDLVKYVDTHWEQCFIDSSLVGKKNKMYTSELDELCARTLDYLQFDTTNAAIRNREIFIPSQLIQLLDMMKSLIPEYKLFAIDSGQRQAQYNIFTKLKYLLGFQPDFTSSMLIEPQLNYLWSKNPSKKINFIPNFNHLSKILQNVNDLTRAPETESLQDFISDWVDDSMKPISTNTLRRIKTSSLHILHS